MKTILVANRGEIACRIIKAARSLGIQTVAVYSDADAGALHCEMADFAVRVGPPPATLSYLNTKAVLQAGLDHGADGVHPGYGFLSESTTFATEAESLGMVWIGPSPKSIEEMGDKQRARQLAKSSGVPVLPGSRSFLPEETSDELLGEAQSVGFPLLVKAAGGGGGIGMRRVDSLDAVAGAVSATQAQAKKAFGDASVYLERFVPRARHIEVQVFGYGDGTAVHLFERDCSVQRRFQKIIEESPAPNLAPAVLDRMLACAVSLCAKQKYRGAGTVEFILDADSNEFFFLEMNTRIQVEHGVTECVTGWDLVRSQILLAAGRLTPTPQELIHRNGSAVECRLYAENPAKNFLPSPGTLDRFSLPTGIAGLRIDTGLRQGDSISAYYDPMIAKLISYGSSRGDALVRMDQALVSTEIVGIRHNVDFLLQVIRHEAFLSGAVDTAFVDREKTEMLAKLVEAEPLGGSNRATRHA